VCGNHVAQRFAEFAIRLGKLGENENVRRRKREDAPFAAEHDSLQEVLQDLQHICELAVSSACPQHEDDDVLSVVRPGKVLGLGVVARLHRHAVIKHHLVLGRAQRERLRQNFPDESVACITACPGERLPVWVVPEGKKPSVLRFLVHQTLDILHPLAHHGSVTAKKCEI